MSLLGTLADGGIAVAARSARGDVPCAGPVPGLGSEPLPAGGAVIVLDADGAFARRVTLARLPVTANSAGDLFWPVGKATAEGEVLWVVPPHWGGSSFQQLTPARDGGLLFTASNAQTVARVLAGGATAWEKMVPAAGAVQELTDGAIAVPVNLPSGAWSSDLAGAVPDVEGASVLVLEPDGRARGFAIVPGLSTSHAVALAGGGVALFDSAACTGVWALTSDLSPAWNLQLDRGCATAVRDAVLASDGTVVVATRVAGAESGDARRLDAGSDAVVVAITPPAR